MRAKIIIIAAVLGCVVAIGAWYFWAWEYSPPYLELDFLSLNRGHGIFIRLPDKSAVLIDGGQSGDIVANLSQLLPFYRRSISAIFITSPDPKSVGGLVDVLARYSIGQIYVPKNMATTSASLAALSLAQKKNIPIKELSAGDLIDLEKDEKGNVQIKTLFPDPLFEFSTSSPSQFVLQLSYANTSVTFAASASRTLQNFLVNAASSSLARSDILEYEGSAGASDVSEKFIESIAPQYIVVKTTGREAKPPSKPPKKPPFTIHSYSAEIDDLFSGSAKLFSDGEKIWLEK
jgi:competence protein ComEC